MITLYGKTYAKNDREFTGSLFTPGGTCNGFYKTTKAGIYLSDMQGAERVFIRRDGLGPVTVARDPKGRRRYMFATSSLDGAWLGAPESYMAEREDAARVARCVFGD